MLMAPNTVLGNVGRDPLDGLKKRVRALEGPTRHVLQYAGLRRGALPDYVLLGAMKAGSTMFYDFVTSHPLVLPALTKEVHFFDSHFLKGVTWYRAQMASEREREALQRATGYRPVVGEATPNYLFHPLAPHRARGVVPDAKLIVILRDPVKRAYSHYQTGLRHDWEALPFETALDNEERRLENQIDALLMDEANHRSFPRYRWSYQAMGRYAELLEIWFSHFPREQFLIVFNEDMDRGANAVFQKVFAFLDLPAFDLPHRRRRVVGRYDPMKPETRARLEEYFRPHNAKLAQLLDCELPWDY